MEYKKGQLLTYSFPQRQTTNVINSKVIRDFHRVVVLHKRQTPYHTILIAPITEANSLGSKNNIPPNYVKILKEDYPMFLDEDSYINLDMTMPVDESELMPLTKGISRIKLNGVLNPQNLVDLDYKMLITYELDSYVNQEVNKQIGTEMDNIIEYISTDTKQQIISLFDNVSEKGTLKLVLAIIDNLISELKTNYNI